MTEKTLICMVGLPRSGKSTWAIQQGHPVVNPDSIRLALHGQRYVGVAEPFVWAIAKNMVRSLFIAGHSTVILDATNVLKRWRDEWKDVDWTTYFKVIDTPFDICIRRAKEEDDEEIIPIIMRMNDIFEPLTEELVI